MWIRSGLSTSCISPGVDPCGCCGAGILMHLYAALTLGYSMPTGGFERVRTLIDQLQLCMLDRGLTIQGVFRQRREITSQCWANPQQLAQKRRCKRMRLGVLKHFLLSKAGWSPSVLPQRAKLGQGSGIHREAACSPIAPWTSVLAVHSRQCSGLPTALRVHPPGSHGAGGWSRPQPSPLLPIKVYPQWPHNPLTPHYISVFSHFNSVAQSCPTLCNPVDCSMPGLPVHHQLPEFTQTHVYWVSDAIHHLILCRRLLLLPSIFRSVRVFSNKSILHMRWPKYCSFSISPSNEYLGLTSFKIDWFDLLTAQGTLKSLLQHHSSKASILRCSAFFMVQLSHPYTTTGKTIALARWTFVGKVMSLLFNMLSRLVIAVISVLSVTWNYNLMGRDKLGAWD